MNKIGHLSFGIALCAAYMAAFEPQPQHAQDWLMMAVTAGGAAAGALAPDLDHKTSTASKWISPFPARWRKRLRAAGSLLLTAAGALLVCWLLARASMLPALPGHVLKAIPLAAGAGIVAWTLARLREVVLIFVGALLLAAWALYGLHWFVLFAGVTLLILPALKHRGLIHTPEFAIALTIGAFSLVGDSNEAVAAMTLGIVTGWWSHLAGDLFGREGIHSLFVPRVRLAFRLFRNGGAGEKLFSSLCWAGTAAIFIWIGLA